MMKSKKYKIVFCTPAIYSAGGVERVITVKASYFADCLGYDVTIIVTEGKGRESYFQVSDKVNVINFELGYEDLWKASFFKKILLYIHKQRQFRKLLTSELIKIRPDFTISTLRREINFLADFNFGGFKIGELHVNRSNYRSYGSGKVNLIKRLFSAYWKRSLVSTLNKIDKLVVLTDSALSDWPELDHLVLIPDPLPFKIDAKSNLLHRRVISIGRYDYDKGNDLLLNIWKRVESKMPGWSLDVFGNGNRETYQNMMQQLGIDSSCCHLYGPTHDVKKEYLSSSVFVLPSRYEGFGLVLIEAMACGVPVISFDCENGPRSIITDGHDGFLISPFDVDEYAEKLISLMQNQSLRQEMGMNARKSAEKYEMDKIGAQWQQLFDELMAQR